MRSYLLCLLLAAPALGADGPPSELKSEPSAIHLAWVEDPSTTMTIVWHTASPEAPSVVEYRPAGTRPWRRAAGAERLTGAPGKVHEATLRGLTPSTRYEYRFGPDHTYTMRTAPAGSAPFEAIFVADTGMIGREDGLGTGVEQVIAEIGQMDPLIVLLGGDYAYFNTDPRWGTLDKTILAWFEQMKPIAVKAPMMPTYGNHEIFLREGYLFWAEHFPTPEGFDNRRYYSFDIGDAHFVSILAANSERGPLARSAIDWIDRDMAAARRAGKKWIIPFLHVAPFSDGSNHPSNEDLRRQLGPLFERHEVKVALSCHDQSYERTYPLRGVPDHITPTSKTADCYTMNDGVSYLKVSPGGKLSNINKSFAAFKTHPPPYWTAFRDNTRHHFAKLTITPRELRVEIYGVKGDGSPPIVQDRLRYSESCPH